MIEKIGPIKNPLTIIAIFAAIAEISGTVILPFISQGNQETYVWFLIVFPILLILLFFLTLNFNHKVLYAPSDYQDEDNFLRSLPRSTFAEKAQKIEAELAKSESVDKQLALSPNAHTSQAPVGQESPQISYEKILRRSNQARYLLIEELIFQRLSREFNTQIQRDVKLGPRGKGYIFDGIVREKGVTTIVEAKYLPSASMIFQLRGALELIAETSKRLPSEQESNLRVLFAVATDDDLLNEARLTSEIDNYRSGFPFVIDFRLYNLADLEREFKIRV